MLLSSKLHSYAHAIKSVESTRKAIAPQALTLGLTLETALQTQATLHMLDTAEGLNPIGRMVIAESVTRRSKDNPRACLGYLYDSRTINAQDDVATLRTHNSSRLLLEPKLVLSLSQTPDASTTLEEFSLMFDSIALGLDVLKVPYQVGAWLFEDKVCSNGLSHQLIVGEAKTLSEKRKRNFSQVVNHAVFSLNRVTNTDSQLLNYANGSDIVMSSINELYELFQHHLQIDECSPFHQNDLISLNALCPPVKINAGEEYVCVASGIDLETLRIRFVQ